VTSSPFRLHDFASKPVKVILGTIGDRANHALHHVGVHFSLRFQSIRKYKARVPVVALAIQSSVIPSAATDIR
jgi:hypothetical protein